MYVSLVKKGDIEHRTYRRAVMMGNTYCISDDGKYIAYARCYKDCKNKDKRRLYVYVLNDKNFDEYVDIIKRFIRKSDKAEGEYVKRRQYNIARVNQISLKLSLLCF